jgi:hypothetical protein
VTADGGIMTRHGTTVQERGIRWMRPAPTDQERVRRVMLRGLATVRVVLGVKSAAVQHSHRPQHRLPIKRLCAATTQGASFWDSANALSISSTPTRRRPSSCTPSFTGAGDLRQRSAGPTGGVPTRGDPP